MCSVILSTLLSLLLIQSMTVADHHHYMQSDHHGHEETPPPELLSQWVSKVIGFSTEYDPINWSASQIIGEPKVYPRHGDIRGSWTALIKDANQFIEVEFETAVKHIKIDIYETFHPGGIVNIKVKGPTSDGWTPVWHANRPRKLTHSRIFSPPIPPDVSELLVNQIRIEVDLTAANHWVELDAVKLTGVLQPPFKAHDHCEYMIEFLNNDLYHDVTITVGNKTIHAHRFILGTRSPYFARIFAATTDWAELSYPGLPYNDFMAAFTVIYTHQLPPETTIETLANLWQLSALFEVDDIAKSIVRKVNETISLENAIPIYLSQTRPEAGEVRSICLHFITAHLVEFLARPDFGKDLSKENLIEILRHVGESHCT